jgi:hypothetical protein
MSCWQVIRRQRGVSREGREGGEGGKLFPSVFFASFARPQKSFQPMPRPSRRRPLHAPDKLQNGGGHP